MARETATALLPTQNLNDRLAQALDEYGRLVVVAAQGNGSTDDFKNALVRLGELERIVRLKERLEEIRGDIASSDEIARQDADPALKQLADEELGRLSLLRQTAERELMELLVPPDPDNIRNAIIEIRAGTGGEEAALFARDLFRMYSRFAEKNHLSVEILDSRQSDRGGFSEIISFYKGRGSYGIYRYESGVHRVQRVPETEASGRIHTSAATVMVFPETEESQVKITSKDLKIDTFCSSGAGGQSVNKTSSAVRITHLPTGIVVSCQDERSQIQNRAKAMKILLARLKHSQDEEKRSTINKERRDQVKTGDRSEKIRTYNFPQNRVTDHRINLTLYHLERIMDGDMDELLDNLRKQP